MTSKTGYMCELGYLCMYLFIHLFIYFLPRELL